MPDSELDRVLVEKAKRTTESPHWKSGILELTEANFDELINGEKPTFVDFWAAWCGPCKAMEPIVERLAAKYSGAVSFGKLNVDEHSSIGTRYDVQSIPTFMIFRRGAPVDAVIGAVAEQVLEQHLRKVAGG